MNCYFHPSAPAVTQCADCHKGLCHSCAAKYSLPICDACNKQRKLRETMAYIKPLIVCAILYIIGYNLAIMGQDQAFSGYMVMSIYAGWKIINQFLPNLFIWFNIQAFFWYYLIRIVLSMFIGALATPFYIGYCIIQLIRVALA